jgi:hypothetical protein
VRDDFPTAFDDALDEQTGVCVVWLLDADFGPTAGVLSLWTGVGVLSVGDQDYQGGAQLIEVSEGQESAEGDPGQLQFALPWKDPVTLRDYVADAMSAQAGGLALWYEAHLSPAGALTSDPVPMWGGRISAIRIAEQPPDDQGGRGVLVTVTAGDGAAPADRAETYRMTAASQLQFDDTDQGLSFLSTLGSVKVKWGGLYHSRERD